MCHTKKCNFLHKKRHGSEEKASNFRHENTGYHPLKCAAISYHELGLGELCQKLSCFLSHSPIASWLMACQSENEDSLAMKASIFS